MAKECRPLPCIDFLPFVPLLAWVLLVTTSWTHDAHARPAVPIGVAYDTPLEKGEWSLFYIYQRIEGKGLRKGKDRVESDELVDAPVTQVPVEMEVDVHTVGIRHAPFERLTLVARLPLLSQKMRQRDFDDGGDRYTTHSSGVGDLEIVGLVPFMEKRDETLDLHLGLRFPTGEINNKDDVPDGAGGKQNVLLPLPMQIGSHTFAMLFGLTYQGHWQGLGWGLLGGGAVGFGDNHRGYRLGNEMLFTGWLAHDVTSWLSGSFRLGFDRWNRLHGSSRSGPENHQVSYQSASAGKRLALGPGLSVALPWLGAQRLSIEASWPVYQSYKGGQVERDWSLTTGWEWTF
ncbi:MAG: hypothetical protein JRG94_21180 [Deltaproteobacteria bacterium]|nr:hypothetical protein [Deltaproteobacteria bacterium]MBW2723277.1 hypothetical protein [Deltaproteobacteria bacterium]